MKVTIQKGQNTAVTQDGKIYDINGLVIKVKDTGEERFYDKESRFFKVAAAENTQSHCVLLPNGQINLL